MSRVTSFLRLVAPIICSIAVTFGTNAAPRTAPPPASGTVFGTVTCEGLPVADVIVSDGALFTKTDSLGRYTLPSLKYYGSVFIVTPSGYEPECKKGVLPQFWASLNSRKPTKVEQHDFALRKVDQRRHRMIVSADMHLANRNEDLLQLKKTYIPTVQRIAAEAKRDTIPAYSIILGDLSINSAWYSSEFDVSDALHTIVTSGYPTMLYTAIGEMDHDGAIAVSPMTDYRSEQLYVSACGPRFYSMNIGEVHYVVLDNTVFLNEPGNGKYPTEIVGKRNFDRRVTADQLSWLRRDLSFVKDKQTPIVVCMHHNVLRCGSKGKLIKCLSRPEDTDSLTACLRDFANVRFLTGHSHRRRFSAPKELPNIVEHAISSASGNNWESGYNGYPHICSDGTDAGIEVFSFDGRDVKWEFVSQQNPGRTFRAYDMNSVGEYYRSTADVQNLVRNHSARIDYGAPSFSNYVYINYWGDEPQSKIEAFDGDKPLKVRRITQEDPLYTLATAVVRLRNSRGRKMNFGRNNSQHLFRIKTDTATTTIRIRTTDPFGRIFEDSVVRPQPFPPTMTTSRKSKKKKQ
ncbi:MAG: calcineurin-like phosphoesterase C-terminal domain-containing protein [Alistipes sp.]|nr:calcineurin-like phosphoesterase C-terminal domain-containing protein [Alistipes sp.]